MMNSKEEIREYGKMLGFPAMKVTTREPLLYAKKVLREYQEKKRLSSLLSKDIERLIYPSRILPGLSSIILVLLPYYHQGTDKREKGEWGVVARYAWGLDYHQVMKERLIKLKAFIQKMHPSCQVKTYVDTGPILEKTLAIRSGLGWRGKNTLLITEKWGSFVFIGTLFTDLPLEPDSPILQHYCGQCNACLKACPTAALSPYSLNPKDCISEATMGRGKIPLQVRERMGLRIWGCDTCQDVCPFNQKVLEGNNAFKPGKGVGRTIHLSWLLSLSEEEFTQEFQRTPLFFRGFNKMRENASIALANSKGGRNGETDLY